MKKVMGLMMALVLCVSSFVGCGSSSSEGEGERETVRLAIMTTGFTVPLNYAVENGYFEELGLDVEVEYFANGPAINEAIASGDIDFGGIGEMPSITGAITNGSKIVGWACDDEASIQCYTRNDSDIVKAGKGHVAEYPEIYGTADTWKGKKVICAKGTSSHYGLLATLAAFGLTEKDIEFINMEGTAGAAAFASGTGDIFFGFDPQWAEFYAKSDEYTQISTCKNAGKSLGNTLVASKDFAENHGDALTKVLQAILKAENDFRNDEKTYYDAMFNWQNTYGSCTEDIATYSASIKEWKSYDEQKAFMDDSNGESQIMTSINEVAQFMVDNEVISQEDKDSLVDIAPVDYSFLYKAIDNLSK